jgi:predicted aspartyl protease
MNMGDIKFADGAKIDQSSKFMILDSGLTYTLIPTEDFNKLTTILSTKYGVNCTK